MKLLKLAITPGEPAGIGPDLLLSIAQEEWPAQLVAFADGNMLRQRAKQLNLAITLVPYDESIEHTLPAGQLFLVDIKTKVAVISGKLDSEHGHSVVETLRQACKKNLDGEFDAVVTGPVHKGIINEAGISFSGHTEFFAHESNTNDVVMMLATEGLRVVLATTHIPLAYGIVER